MVTTILHTNCIVVNNEPIPSADNDIDDCIFLKSKSGSSITNENILQIIDKSLYLHPSVESYGGADRIPYDSNIRDYWTLREK